MAEIGVLASVIAIAGLGIKLSKTLYQIGHKTVSANHAVNRIATQVTLFSATLKHVGVVLSDSASLHSPEAIETVERIVKECEVVFKEITQLVVSANKENPGRSDSPVGANGRKRRMSLFKKSMWYFESPKADYLLAQLECLKTTLGLFLQTLALATITARAKQAQEDKQQITQQVEQQRIHVETLIMAQQLSFVVVQEMHHKEPELRQRSPSPANSDDTIEIGRPSSPQRLITLGAPESMSMIKLESGDLGFVRSDELVSGRYLDDSTTPVVAPIFENSTTFVDRLLQRWTRLGDASASASSREPSPMTAARGSIVEIEPAMHMADIHTGENPRTGIKTPDSETEAASERYSTPQQSFPSDASVQSPAPTSVPIAVPTSTIPPAVAPPVFQVPAASSNELYDEQTTPTTSPSAKWLDPSKGPPKGDRRAVSPMPRPNGNSSTLAPPATRNLSTSLPNASVMPNSSQRAMPELAQLQTQALSPTPNLPLVPRPPMHMTHVSSPTSGNLAYYTHRGGSRRSHGGYPPSSSNYRPAYVTTYSSSDEDSDEYSDNGHLNGDGIARRRRRPGQRHRDSTESQESRRDSGFGNGLGIPWRVRVSAKDYCDFLDDEIWGPRTPFRPSPDKIPWLYSQPTATTEISKKWVDEPAIMEKKYVYREMSMDDGDGNSNGLHDGEGGWKIMQPLHFHEINWLVERTAQLFKQRNSGQAAGGNPRAAGQQQPGSPTSSRPHYPQPFRPGQFGPGAGPAGTPPVGQQPSAQARRTVSFQETGPQNAYRDRSPRQFADNYTRGPPPWAGSPGPSNGGALYGGPLPPPPGGPPPAGHMPPMPRGGPGHQPSNIQEYNRWLNHEQQDQMRAGWDRDHKGLAPPQQQYAPDRPNSRGRSSGTSGHRDRKDKDKDKDRKKKHSGASMAATMGKIAGLAAILEGLDGI